MKSFNKIFFAFIFAAVFNLLNAQSVSASPKYPIEDLGNCRNASECKLYCDIPANSPSCWSYDKYVLNKNVLGEETVNITYPISQLGNCANAQACFLYCAQPKNQESCLTYAKNMGLVKDAGSDDDGENEIEDENEQMDEAEEREIVEDAKSELGCTSKESCMALCNDPANIGKCRDFAARHNLDKKGKGRPNPEVIKKAKSELGCDSESSCMQYCQDPKNQDKCFEFARKNNLMKVEDAKKYQEMKEQKQELVREAKKELGCDSAESCSKMCSDPQNREKCKEFTKKFSAGGPNIPQNPKIGPQSCTDEKECREYCQKHPDECPGFNNQGQNNQQQQNPQISNSPKEGKSLNSKEKTKAGSFLGPTGCKTEEECKNYCQKHPDECPGFPQKSEQKSDELEMINKSPDKSKAKISPSEAKVTPKLEKSEQFEKKENKNSGDKQEERFDEKYSFPPQP